MKHPDPANAAKNITDFKKHLDCYFPSCDSNNLWDKVGYLQNIAKDGLSK